jgi:3-hydroxyacyl-[acyl-carrier-protein] dehydratase
MTENAEQTVRTDIDIAEILARIHRYPFLLVDRAEDYKPHQSIVGIKCVTVNEPFFRPSQSNPVMPGVLIIEALAQTGAVLMVVRKSTPRARPSSSCRSTAPGSAPVRPGDVIPNECQVLRARRSSSSRASPGRRQGGGRGRIRGHGRRDGSKA